MTIDTTKLIDQLAEKAEPVRPLSDPWLRASAWLVMAVPYVALVILVVSPRDDLMVKISDWRFVVEQFAALLTAVAAAVAAFATTVPGYDRRILVVPLLPLAVWLGSLGQGCIRDWMQSGLAGLSLQPDWFCFPAIVLVGAVPAIAMALMLRRGAPLAPHISTALGGLAAAGLGNFGLRLFHPQDASVMVLVWQFGSVFVLVMLAGCLGHYLLSWRALVDPAAPRIAVRG